MKTNLVKALAILMMSTAMVGCSSNNGSIIAVGDAKVETVTLSKDNVTDYVATYSSAALIDAANNVSVYHCHFVGADNCKFIDCSIQYTWQSGNATGTAHLTISGDGEAIPCTGRRVACTLVITGATGKVQILK